MNLYYIQAEGEANIFCVTHLRQGIKHELHGLVLLLEN